MFGSEMLDVVIGMIFVFLTLSLVCSAVNEIIEAWLNKRADYLEKGIKELLDDKDGKLVKVLYEHPLIAGLFRGKYEDKDRSWKGKFVFKGTHLPSYIPAENFANALIDIILSFNKISVSDNIKSDSNDIKSTSDNKPSPLLASLRKLPGLKKITVPAIDDLNLESSLKALRALVGSAGNNDEKVRKNIENWFNGSMDRVSGWYKRRTQVIVLLLGLGVAIGVNADAISICNTLSHDKALRDSLAASAGEYSKADAATSNHSSSCSEDANAPRCKLDAQMAKIKNLGLPIGWDRSDPKLFPLDWGGWLLKVFGWLITAFAISLGAPFWFDLLNKFMVVRSTVKPKEKSPDEPSKS